MLLKRKLGKCRCIYSYWKELLSAVVFLLLINLLISKLTDELATDVVSADSNKQSDDRMGLLQYKAKSSLDKRRKNVNLINVRSPQNILKQKQFEFRLKRYNEYRKKEPYRTGPGEKGEGVILEGEEKKQADALFKKAAFNVIASEKISLDRSVGDARREECRNMTYSHDLPTASVVIIYTNEAWTPLLRTVHSVVNRSPPHLLHEVILLDDFSDRPELGQKLDDYIKLTWPDGIVRVVRQTERCGIMKARTEGARAATGDVVVFLDSHCETSTQWLEPLLTQLKESPNSIVCPIIDVISDNTLEYSQYGGLMLGGFSWSMHFTWIDIPQRELARQKSPTDALRSATMAGGLLAVRRDYFFEIGAYDEGMEVWGGENLEISFRVWMCGGKLEFIPCSRVGHIFRSSHPYTFPDGKDTHGINTLRMATVWMDDYTRFFYQYRPEMRKADYGDVSNRKALRTRLKCNNFSWFLKNVFPEKFILDENVQAFGQLKNTASNMCLDMMSQDERKPGIYVGLYLCHPTANMNQMFSLSNAKELRREDVCSYTSPIDDKVPLMPCNGSPLQTWIHTKHGHMMNPYNKLCLDTANRTYSQFVRALPCTGAATQKWEWIPHVLHP